MLRQQNYRKPEQDFMAYKTIVVPILGMEGATDSWKTKFHVYNSKIGCLLSPPRSGETCHVPVPVDSLFTCSRCSSRNKLNILLLFVLNSSEWVRSPFVTI